MQVSAHPAAPIEVRDQDHGNAIGASPADCPRVLIVASNASAKFGGEAALPLHYFRVLRRRGHDVRLLVHARTRGELEALFPGDPSILYVEDDWLDRTLYRIGGFLPARLETLTTGFLMGLHTQLRQKSRIRELIRSGAIDIIHQPTPVSPREPSLLFNLPVPVVIGPMNGNMSFPAAFRALDNAFVRACETAARRMAWIANILLPGKRQAALLLVANERTRQGLPCGGYVVECVENGVDFSLWQRDQRPVAARSDHATRFAYVGRLVDWKAIDLLIAAFELARNTNPMELVIVGDGPERPRLEAFARDHGLLADELKPGSVWFAGWRSQHDCASILAGCDAMTLPSLRECGGAVVLEAMAMGLPVIATEWGGPADYLDTSCGILVEPSSRSGFIDGLSAAMVRLASSPELRSSMGRAAREKAQREFDWEAKVDRMIGMYGEVVSRRGFSMRNGA